MTQSELFIQLKTTGYPVVYSHFDSNDNNPPPEPPYIVYFRLNDDNISSDAKVHGKFKNYQVELYTSIKDLAAERKLEAVLNEIDTEYETFETYIESERLYQVVYQITVIEKY
jgi:hypothetical protein